MKHTKGNWLIINWGKQSQIRDEKHNEIALLGRSLDGTLGLPGEEQRANARLISQAPNMLLALQEVAEHHQGMHSAIGAMLRNVIAKATGQPLAPDRTVELELQDTEIDENMNEAAALEKEGYMHLGDTIPDWMDGKNENGGC